MSEIMNVAGLDYRGLCQPAERGRASIDTVDVRIRMGAQLPSVSGARHSGESSPPTISDDRG
jgi:hypothetical protein